MVIRYILFDLDNTLYPREAGLFRLIEERIKEYLRMRLDLTHQEAVDLWRRYIHAYGFTLVGLVKHHSIDPEDYLAFVHEVDVEGVLGEDPGLVQMMSRIPLEKVIVTNGSQRHALRVLRSLGIKSFFSHIFDITFMNYRPKPLHSSFYKVMDHLGVQGEECLLLDDHPPTVGAGKELGMTAVYVGKDNTVKADYHISGITDLDAVLEDLQLVGEGRLRHGHQGNTA